MKESGIGITFFCLLLEFNDLESEKEGISSYRPNSLAHSFYLISCPISLPPFAMPARRAKGSLFTLWQKEGLCFQAPKDPSHRIVASLPAVTWMRLLLLPDREEGRLKKFDSNVFRLRPKRKRKVSSFETQTVRKKMRLWHEKCCSDTLFFRSASCFTTRPLLIACCLTRQSGTYWKKVQEMRKKNEKEKKVCRPWEER